MIKVFIESIRRSWKSDKLVVLLKEENGDRYLPIWADRVQGDSLTLALQGKTDLPYQAYDIVKTLVGLTNLRIEKVIISDLQNDIYHAKVKVKKGNQLFSSSHEIQCYPLAGLNLAARTNAPIFVVSEVMDKASIRSTSADAATPTEELAVVYREGNMYVRLANKGDAETIASMSADILQLHAEALPHIFKTPSSTSASVSEIVELLSDTYNHFFIGFENSEPIGYVYVQVVSLPETSSRYATNYLHTHEIAVKPAFRNKGYGKRLLSAVRELARRRGNATIGLDVWSFNTNARAFFSKQGFTIMSERMWLQSNSNQTSTASK